MTAELKTEPAFTLIELEMVIGLILLLAALLFPVLWKAKAEARTAACRSNLRQISLVLTMYVGEFHQYPREANWITTALPWFRSRSLLPYTANNSSVFHCPAHRLAVKSKSDQKLFDPISYGYNSLGSASGVWQGLGLGAAAGRAISEAQVKEPSAMIAVGDSGADALWDVTLNPNEQPPPVRREDLTTINSWLPSVRHRGGANILFCDGHVEHASRQLWIEKTDSARRRWNNDNLPHPETWIRP